MQQADQDVAELGVAVGGGAGQVVVEASGLAYGVAVPVEAPGGEVVGVGVHPDHGVRAGRRQGTVFTGGIVHAAVTYQRPGMVSSWMR